MLQYIPFIGETLGRFFGSKEKRDQYQADARASVYKQFGNEFGHSKTWWDSLIDGLNRLPRPIMTFGVIGLFTWCGIDPVGFIEYCTALQAMPQEGWVILGAIVTFWFAAKLPKDFGKMKMRKSAEEIVRDVATVRKLRPPPPSSFKDPQEGVEWDEKVAKRYSSL